jgi:DNA-binding IclR family transcriptional regulator
MSAQDAQSLAQAPNGQRLLGSALKCLALIEDLAAAPGPLGVTDIARRTDSRRGTVHQQLRTLIAAGWVEQLQDSRYRLTLRAVSIGTAVLEQADLGSRVLPTLTTLAAETGETASIAVLDGGTAMLLQRVAADRALRADIKPGTRMPLALSASGRVLVAFASEHELHEVREAGVELPPEPVLVAARREGYAFQDEEYLEGMSSMAVPITATKLGTVALAITTPAGRFNLKKLLPKLVAAETELSQLLGG